MARGCIKIYWALLTVLWLLIGCFVGNIHAQQTLAPSDNVPLARIARQLKTTGLTGYIHAANPATKMCVLTVIGPGNTSRNVALIAANEAVWRQLQRVHRYDRVRVKGTLSSRVVPQAHAVINAMQVVKSWQPDSLENLPPLQVDDNPPDPFTALVDQHELTGTIHAVEAQGQVVLFDYQGAVFPLMAADNAQTRHLWRGDRVKLRLSMMVSPQSPLHLMLEPTTPDDPTPAVQVIERIRDLDQKVTTITGHLVLYPKSPAMAENTWALAQTLSDGSTRYFLLTSAWGKNGQTQLNHYLSHLWKTHADGIQPARQKWINPAFKLAIKGTVHVTEPNQFQPLLKITGPQAIQPPQQE